MSTKTEVNKLWEQFRQAINAAYAEADKANDEDGMCLKDYAEDISWHDDLAKLLGREAANERQHRRSSRAPADFSIDTASKLILMSSAAFGASKDTMPKATAFLMLRQTAVEAETIGFLARKHLSQEWRDAVNGMDYAKLMKVESAS